MVEDEGMKKNNLTICYTVNNNMAIPALVSMYTALKHTKYKNMEIYVFHNGLTKRNLKIIGNTISSICDISFTKINNNQFEHFDSLHGEYINWIRILLPDLLPKKDRLLYIDADTLVMTDLSSLAEIDINNYSIAAVAGAEVRYALDSELLISKGINPDSRYFNAGFILFNSCMWRNKKEFKKICQFANNNRCPASDQSALNYVFNNRFYHLHGRFNKKFKPNSNFTGDVNMDCVVHFVGSPKPWDIMGRVIHNNSYMFYKYIEELNMERDLLLQKISLHNIYRSLKIGRSYFRSLQRRCLWQ